MDWFKKKFDELSGKGAQAQPQRGQQPMPIYISPQQFQQPPAYSLSTRPQVKEILPGLSTEPDVQPNIYMQNGVPYHAPGYTGDVSTLPKTTGRSGQPWSPVGMPAMPLEQPSYPEFRTRRPM